MARQKVALPWRKDEWALIQDVWTVTFLLTWLARVPWKDIKACMFPLSSCSSDPFNLTFVPSRCCRNTFLSITATYQTIFSPNHPTHLSVTMHTALCIAALAGLAYSAPQLINLDEIAADFPAPVLVKAPVNVVSNIPAPSTPVDIVPLQSSSAKKRELKVAKRDGDCSPYPTGSGPVPTPDTPAAFQSDPDFAVCLCYRRTPHRPRF